jgi:hypothetical protein
MNSGLDDIALDKALKRMSGKQLALMAYKMTQQHIASCQESSDRVYRVLKWVGGAVAALALEKMGEVLHVPHLTNLIGS